MSGALGSRRRTWLAVLVVVSLSVGLGAVLSQHHAPPAPSYSLVQVPQQGYDSIYSSIDSAHTSIDMVMYALADPKAVSSLVAAAHRGVDVRVLFDGDNTNGGGAQVDQAAYQTLTAAGAHARFAWPGVLWHQKSFVVDDHAVTIMTANLEAQYYPVVRGFFVTTTDPATVTGVETTFTADFTHTGSAPAAGSVPAGSELLWSPGTQPALVGLIDSARPGTTLVTETEQFTSAPITQALVAAARRGVVVDVVMTQNPDYVTAFTSLAAGGVHVRLFAPTAPLYIQSKALSVNGTTLYVGSTNFTPEMMNADRNVGVVTTDPPVVAAVTATMRSDFAAATPFVPAPATPTTLATPTT